MRKEELLKIIEELPDGCEIGSIDVADSYVDKTIRILASDGYVNCTKISDIEKGRRSNKNRICDYYIV